MAADEEQIAGKDDPVCRQIENGVAAGVYILERNQFGWPFRSMQRQSMLEGEAGQAHGERRQRFHQALIITQPQRQLRSLLFAVSALIVLLERCEPLG